MRAGGTMDSLPQLGALRGQRESHHSAAADAAAEPYAAPRPDVSVIIPTFNRRAILLHCIEALVQQERSEISFEIVIVDDGSTDGTSEAVAAVARTTATRIVCERQSNAGANAARNRAMRLAQGRILLFLNDDSIASAGLIAEHLRSHERHPEVHSAILGALRISPELAPSVFNALHHDARFDAMPPETQLDWRSFYTYNVSIKREFVGEACFDTRLRWHEDIEFGRRLSERGLAVFFVPSAAAYHFHALSESDFFNMADREGRALVSWLRAMPQLAPELVDLGLRSARLGTRAVRHVIADAVIKSWTWPFWTLAARKLAVLRPAAGQTLYRKLYQWRCRQAIEHELVCVDAAPMTLRQRVDNCR